MKPRLDRGALAGTVPANRCQPAVRAEIYISILYQTAADFKSNLLSFLLPAGRCQSLAACGLVWQRRDGGLDRWQRCWRVLIKAQSRSWRLAKHVEQAPPLTISELILA